jgi:hypothetical protein
MVTDGTLAMYGKATGVEPMKGTCDQAAWMITTIQLLYPFSAPDCDTTITYPNAGVTGGPSTLTVGGYTIGGVHHITGGIACVTISWPANNGGVNYVPGSSPRLYIWNVSRSAGPITQNITPPSLVSACGSGSIYAAYDRAAYGDNVLFGLSTSSTVVPTGSARQTMLSADPMRVPSCQLTWPGGDVTTVTGTAAQKYKESAGLPIADFSALCNDGFVSKPGHGPDLLPSEIKIGETNEETGAFRELQKATVPEFTPDEKKGLTPGTSTGGLVLQRVVGTVVRNCLTWEVNCGGWYSATSNATNPIVSDGYYRCLFNGAPVTLLECSPYRATFDTQTANPTITDPTTGTTGPWSSGSPGTSTSSGTLPQTGTNPGAAVSVATGGGGCTAGWSWNPVDWVLNPMRCAFIPSTATVTATTTAISTAWADTWPVQGMAAVTGVFAAVPSASGCAGPRLQFDLTWPAPVHFDAEPLNACNAPVSTLAWFARVIGAISIMFATAWGVTRRIGAIVNAKGVGPG